MIYAWHKQSSFSNACITEHSNICLQIENFEYFPDLSAKHDLINEFPNSMVQFPIVGRELDLDMHWVEYRTMNIILPLGDESNSSHYQDYILTNGRMWK